MIRTEDFLHPSSPAAQGRRAPIAARLSAALDVPARPKCGVVSPDVGGGFRVAQPALSPNSFLVGVWAAKRLRRPGALENSDPQRKPSCRISRAATMGNPGWQRPSIGRRQSLLAARFLLGWQSRGPSGRLRVALNNYRVGWATTVYRSALGRTSAWRGVLTNSTPTCPFRGRPARPGSDVRDGNALFRSRGAETPCTFDRIEIRRRKPDRQEPAPPTANAMGLTYDSGDFHGNMAARAPRRAEWKSFPQRPARRGRRAGRPARLRDSKLHRGAGRPRPLRAPSSSTVKRPTGQVEMICGTQIERTGP